MGAPRYRNALLNEQSLGYTRFVSQARFRGEEVELTREQWFDLWEHYWPLRGRHSTDYCISRLDHQKSWSIDNVIVRPRHEHLAQKNVQSTKLRWSKQEFGYRKTRDRN